jgi:hypothetical protein
MFMTLTLTTLTLQGDKLMRLPSHSYDKNDLIRSVSVVADGPEEIVEADDYLQPAEPPHSPRVIFENNNSPTVRFLKRILNALIKAF